MKYSIKKQMMLIFIGLITFTLAAFLMLNGTFLEQYYVIHKQTALVEMYDILSGAAADGALGADGMPDDVAMKIIRLKEKSNISFYIVNEVTGTGIQSDKEGNTLSLQLFEYKMDPQQKPDEIIRDRESYQIRRTTDQRNKSEYLDMWGTTESGYVFIIRTPIEGIRESVKLSNRFLLYIGLPLVLLSAVLVWYFSKRITDPILELAELSKQMEHLDFDARYTRGGEDEIGILGANFNSMSEKLKGAISELKSANYRLQKDIEQKEQLETMRTEFLGNVSHELKTPIALIQGYAEGLKEGISDDPESREFYCDVIMDEANKMNQMVKNLLTLNQLESGDDGVRFERFDIVALIRGVIQSCEILIQQKGVGVNFRQQEPVCVWADEFKTEQVVRNYISNALNHVGGDLVIEVNVVVCEDSARISVFNTGTPIPEEDVDKIWDKFYKVDKARTREYGGNGIGLSIVKAIMESFHQEYGVKNYDNGVEFWFALDVK